VEKPAAKATAATADLAIGKKKEVRERRED